MAAARQGFTATGVELNGWLVLYSKVAARLSRLENRATFRKQDLWTVDLRSYDNIILFGVDEMIPAFEQKIIKELSHKGNTANLNNNPESSGIQVIACRFPLKILQPQCVIGEGIDTVWVYRF